MPLVIRMKNWSRTCESIAITGTTIGPSAVMRVALKTSLPICFFSAGDLFSEPPKTFLRITLLPVCETLTGVLTKTRNCSSILENLSLQILQQGTVIRFDGRGSGKRFFGGRWSPVKFSVLRQR